jgi:hypothetical protein
MLCALPRLGLHTRLGGPRKQHCLFAEAVSLIEAYDALAATLRQRSVNTLPSLFTCAHRVRQPECPGVYTSGMHSQSDRERDSKRFDIHILDI